MKIGRRILFLLDFSNLDDALGPLVQQTDDFVVDPIDFLTIIEHVFGHGEYASDFEPSEPDRQNP
jgi:hypothetical protein